MKALNDSRVRAANLVLFVLVVLAAVVLAFTGKHIAAGTLFAFAGGQLLPSILAKGPPA